MRAPSFRLALACFTLALHLPAQAQQPSMPVILEAGTGLDPCSVGMVTGLSVDGDGFLAVRAGPRADYAKLDELINGDQVFVCDQRGDWLGVVYSKAGRDCDVSSPGPKSRTYAGSCPSGWVFKQWVQIVAG